MITAQIDYFTSQSTGKTALYHWPINQPRYQLLLLHGYGEHLQRYDQLANQLAQHGAWVFGPDHQGHGLSAGERVAITDFHAVIQTIEQAVIHQQQLHPALPLVVLGHSMGGILATRYAQLHQHQLTALILSGPLLGTANPIVQLADARNLPNTPLSVELLSRDQQVGERYAADPLVWHGSFKPSTLQALKTIIGQIEQGSSFSKLPTLWLHGLADQVVDPQISGATLQKLVGNHFEQALFADARHEVFNEINHVEVTQRVIDFLANLT